MATVNISLIIHFKKPKIILHHRKPFLAKLVKVGRLILAVIDPPSGRPRPKFIF